MHGDRLEALAVREQVVDALRLAALEVVAREVDAEIALEPSQVVQERIGLGGRERVLDDRVAVAGDAFEVDGDLRIRHGARD